MAIDLIVRSSPAAIDFAMLKDGVLVELHRQDTTKRFQVGDFYFSKVSKIMPGLNAAFVQMRSKKDGFLHYHDLGPNIRTLLQYLQDLRSKKKNPDPLLRNIRFLPPIKKDGTINQVLKQGQHVLVQVVKEPISTKGPRLTTEISLAGRYLVLIPFNDKVSVSSKIEDKAERDRLKRLANSIQPKNFGLIVRTAAKGIKTAELDRDLQQLLDRWKTVSQRIKTAKTPERVYQEEEKAVLLLRDLLNDDFRSIVVDDKDLFYNILKIVEQINPDKTKIVKYYDGKLPVFEKYGIEKQIKTSFGRTVNMPNGAYLIIEHTEAMHVIDVNSGTSLQSRLGRQDKTGEKEENGTKNGKAASEQEETALQVNLQAAKEIARQLRLRDMGGIIIVDFIDMKDHKNRQYLYQFLKEQMKEDRAKHKILPPTKFGLIQITRQRVRPENVIDTHETNPSKADPDKTDAPVNLITKIEFELEKVMHRTVGPIILAVHPFIAAYLTKGLFSWRIKQMLKFKRRLQIQPRHGFKYLEYRFFDRDGNEVELD